MQKRANQLTHYDSSVSVIVGEPKGKKEYFRAFAGTFTVPPEKGDRLAKLLPYRLKKTMRLYGVSPLVMLSKSKKKAFLQKNGEESLEVKGSGQPVSLTFLPSTKKRTTQLSAKRVSNAQEDKENQAQRDKSRIAGPEISPNMAEANEFESAGSLASLSKKEKLPEEPEKKVRVRIGGVEVAPNFAAGNEFERPISGV